MDIHSFLPESFPNDSPSARLGTSPAPLMPAYYLKGKGKDRGDTHGPATAGPGSVNARRCSQVLHLVKLSEGEVGVVALCVESFKH